MSKNEELRELVTRVLTDRRFCSDETHKALADGCASLFAEIERLSASRERHMEAGDRLEVQRDQLKAEIERQALQFKEWQASHHANYVQVADERDQLQAEVDRLKHEKRLLTEHNEFLASSDSRLAPELRAVKDALGLDFTASVIGEVVPAIEALRKSDQRYRYLRAKGLALEGHDFISFDEIADYRIDIAMGKTKQ